MKIIQIVYKETSTYESSYPANIASSSSTSPTASTEAKANEGWAKLQQIVEDYKKAHNGASVYAPTFIEDCEPAVKKLQEEYGFEYTVEYVQ